MSVWAEIAKRIVPDYESRIASRDVLKSQYQEALKDLEAGDPMGFPENPWKQHELGDSVFDHHLKTKKIIQEKGAKKGGKHHIPESDMDEVKTALDDTVKRIRRVNLKDKIARTGWAVLLLAGIVISLYIAIVGLDSVIKSLFSMGAGNASATTVSF
ncbi:hypothetical protein [Halorussus halophilus]|uniref:hypothetical protein n=1 Tax=Halorussus halophilus TaxID=2650975 RepID=UPI001301900E|nr:hypothetical protein [Halorussus halophilus]